MLDSAGSCWRILTRTSTPWKIASRGETYGATGRRNLRMVEARHLAPVRIGESPSGQTWVRVVGCREGPGWVHGCALTVVGQEGYM